MKKTLITLIFALVSISAFGQASARDGQYIGPKATSVADGMVRRWVINTSTNTITMFDVDGDTLIMQFPASGFDNIFDYAVKKYPDSLLVTTTEFRPQLTHLNTYIRCNKASGQIKFFLPPDSTVNFPIGSTLNVKMDNAAIVTFYESHSVIESKNDSTTINVKGGWATAIKRAANKWDLLGDLQD